MPDPHNPAYPDPELVLLIHELDRARRAGWARVAQLENIIDVLNQGMLAVVNALMDSGQDVTPDVEETINHWLREADRVDPPGRSRWPPAAS